MVSSVMSCFVGILCMILLPAAFATEYCSTFVDNNGYQHEAQQCSSYCCGTCTQMGCCTDVSYRISQEHQAACYGGSTSDKRSKLSTLLGSILGSVLPILLCVGLVICCVAPCCLFYKKCRKGRNQNAGHPNVINLPHRPHNPGQPTVPGYQPVPVQPGYGGPSGPPAYHGGNLGAFSPGQPLYPLPNQPYANPGGMSQPAYNPAYPNQ